MSDPTPEAIEAVSKWLHYANCDAFCAAPVRHAANFATQAHTVLLAIRDAIPRDGTDADAIRESLGLTLRKEYGRGKAGGIADGRRPVGTWKERA